MSDKLIDDSPSKMWYLLPIVLSWIGGIIMFYALKQRNYPLAKNGLILGFILAGIWLFFIFVIPELTSIQF